MSNGPNSNGTIQRATLDALVRKKINIGRSYPATISQDLGTHTYAKIMPPILRCMQSEHNDMLIESPVHIHTEGVAEGMGVMIQRVNDAWSLAEIVSPEAFQRVVVRRIKEQLFTEATLLASPISRRSAKRKFEQWFGLAPKGSTPWALPGMMTNGTPIISRKILEWCSAKGGAAIEQAIRSGSPKKEEWGTGSYHCAVLALDEVKPHFISVIIEEAIYENLMKQWRSLLDEQPTPKPKTHSPKEKSPPVLHAKKSAKVQLFEPEATLTSVTQFSAAQEVPLPNRLLALLEIHHLPRPTHPFSDSIQTLICWTESPSEVFRNRCIDFLLMLLAEGDMVRKNKALETLWPNWHRTDNPFQQLLLLVYPGEEPVAIQSLFSPYAPKNGFARTLSEHLLQRWKKLLNKGNPEPTPQRDASLLEMRKATRVRGLRAADIWVDRLFLSLLSASITNTPLLLGAPRQLVQQLMEQIITPCFAHSKFEMLRLNRRKSHLFGKISRERDIFLLSDLSQALRKAAHSYRNRDTDRWNPYFILVEDIAHHARTADLAQLYTKSHSNQGVMLFSKSENARWLAEYQQLHSKGHLYPS